VGPEAGKLTETIGGVLLLLASLGFTLLAVVAWLPWMWGLHVSNARWLHERGDRSLWVRGTLRIEAWRKRLSV
jgi:hypothetical protein